MIDADKIGHQVLGNGGEAFDRVAETWPSVVVNGVIDGDELADVGSAIPTSSSASRASPTLPFGDGLGR